MAAAENILDIGIQKNSKIVVNVDEVLPDILVVTYEHGNKVFQGVLLDSTKRNLPFGVNSLHPAYDKTDEDKLYSANQRFAYQEGVNVKEYNGPTPKRQVRLPARYKNSKMTVRLRPRQVLCSKCRGICNENSENVDNSRKRKAEDKNGHQPHMQLRIHNQAQQNRFLEQHHPKRLLNHSNVKIAVTNPIVNDIINEAQTEQQQLHQNHHQLQLQEEQGQQEIIQEQFQQPLQQQEQELLLQEQPCVLRLTSSPPLKEEPMSRSASARSKRMVLRKKRSVGSMEDLWDESVFEESGLNELGNNTRTIKISFGSEGEGTVLKIPATKINDLVDHQQEHDKDEATSKAARRALKKAKKEARRKILLGSGGSPCYNLGGGSPRYSLAGGGSPSYDTMVRRHKHKVKHKKKHREERRQREELVTNNCPEAVVANTDPSSADDMKERCLKQKLSISLKRLNADAYTRCDDVSPTKSEEGGSEASDEQSVPDFPPPSQPLMMHITAQAVTSGLGADGRKLGVGDVVWGKIHGFPWWPGKVLSITSVGGDSQAHVAWYGSSTSSLMPCDQLSPFLENFKIRYNKKKRGPYKEAIKQATCEARSESPPSPKEATPPPALVQPALASPREIDVVS